MKINIPPEVAMNQDIKVRQAPDLYVYPMGFYLKRNLEVGRLPADESRKAHFAWKGFEFLGYEGEMDRDRAEDIAKRRRTKRDRQQKKTEKEVEIDE